MLAALRVLHVDPSHTPAAIAWTKEQRSIIRVTPPAATAVSLNQNPSNRTTKTRRRLRVE